MRTTGSPTIECSHFNIRSNPLTRFSAVSAVSADGCSYARWEIPGKRARSIAGVLGEEFAASGNDDEERCPSL